VFIAKANWKPATLGKAAMAPSNTSLPDERRVPEA
jgi:hypothetical protein